MTTGFDGAGFVDTNVTAYGRHDALIGLQDSLDDDGIRLCPAGQKMNSRLRCRTRLTDPCPGRLANFVGPVARRLH